MSSSLQSPGHLKVALGAEIKPPGDTSPEDSTGYAIMGQVGDDMHLSCPILLGHSEWQKGLGHSSAAFREEKQAQILDECLAAATL